MPADLYSEFPGSDAEMFIQWKSTNLCMDFKCGRCRLNMHIHGDFANAIRCPKCGQIYEMGTQVKAVAVMATGFTPITPEIHDSEPVDPWENIK